MGRSPLSKGKKNLPPTGPSGPPAGLLAEIEAAKADRLTADVPALLADLRAGRLEAQGELTSALRWLVYDVAENPAEFEAFVAKRYVALSKCVRRLAENRVPPDNIEKYVRDELSRNRRAEYRKECDHLLVPYSTASDYKNRGKTITGLRRSRQDQIDVDLAPPVMEDPNLPHPLVDQRGKQYVRPSRRVQPTVVDLVIARELRRMVARSHLERQVLAGLRKGRSIRKIAKALGTTKYRIEKVINLLRSRADHLWPDLRKGRSRKAA